MFRRSGSFGVDRVIAQTSGAIDEAQRKWVKAWFGFFAVFIVICLMILSSMPKKKQVETQETMTSFTSTTREMKIPDEVYQNTTVKDKYNELLNADKYIIYWVRYKNDFENSNLEFIQNKMTERKDALKNRFMLIPNLVEIHDENGNIIESRKNIQMEKYDLKPSCENQDKTCFEGWLYENCYNKYCVINPKTKAYIKVGGKKNVIHFHIEPLPKPIDCPSCLPKYKEHQQE